MNNTQYIVPHDNWVKKHGNVYCRFCLDRSKVALVPTTRKSVTFRKEFASCRDCMEKAIQAVEAETKESSNGEEAAFQIKGMFGVEI